MDTKQNEIISERILAEVIDKMVLEIPIGEDNNRLKEDLLRVRNDSLYTAPEVMVERWAQTADVLYMHFPDPRILAPWVIRMVEIFTTKTIEEVIER